MQNTVSIVLFALYEKNSHFVRNGVFTIPEAAFSEDAFTYDDDGRETQTTTIGGKHVNTAYDVLGRVSSQTINTAAAFATAYTYRAAADGSATPVVSSMSHGGKNTAIQYHDDGNIKQITTDAGTVAYEYDSLGQLIRVNDAVNNTTCIYAYDAGFNMTSEKVYAYTTESTPTGDPVSQRVFTYDSVWKDQMVSCDGKAMTYDGMGNLTSFDGATYTWTMGRKLSQITKADGTVIIYEYDLHGRRVKKTVGSKIQLFSYVGDRLFYASSSVGPMYFSYDSVGNPVAVMYNNVEYYYVKNLQGDIIGLVDGNGAWVVEYSYDAWGRILSVTGTLAETLGQENPIRYRGYFYDAETGMYYLKSRYYSPEIGRFISADGQINHGMKGCNIYIYCNNNPVLYYDPSGRACICLTQRVFGNHVCDSEKNSPAEDFGMAMTGISGGIILGTFFADYSYRNGSRPNNIGSGTFEKKRRDLLFGVQKIYNQADEILGILDYVGMAMETAEGISSNIENNKSTPKVVWDATVDTAILGTNMTLTAKSAAAASTAIVAAGSGFGLAVLGGFAVGLLLGEVLSFFGDHARGYLKKWIE